MSLSKLMAASGVLALALGLSGPASAQFNLDIPAWAAAPTQIVSGAGQPDVIFTFVGTGAGNAFPGSTLLDGTQPFPDIQVAAGAFVASSERHRLTFGDWTGPRSAVPYGIQYTIEIAGAFSQALRLQQIFLGIDVDQTNANTRATKYIQGILPDPTDPLQDPNGPTDNWTLVGTVFDQMISTTSGNAGPVACGVCVKFLITDIALFNGTNTLNGFTNTFDIIQPVPEPASLALVGLGLAGLGAMSRRRKLRA